MTSIASPITDPSCLKLAADFESLLLRLATPDFDRGTWSSFVQLAGLVDLMGRSGLTLHGRRCIDFGCGGLKPRSISTLLYLCGARSTLAVDLYRDADPGAVAFAAWACVLTALSGRGDINYAAIGTDAAAVRARAASVDLARLFNGDINGLPSDVACEIRDYRALPREVQEFDALVSFSVFEHVHDLQDCLSVFRRTISPDGFIYATVDYKDHRSYVGPASWWEFMVDDGDLVPDYMTKVRHGGLVGMIEASGFRIGESLIVRVSPPPELRSRFLPKYAALSDDDVSIVEARILLRPT